VKVIYAGGGGHSIGPGIFLAGPTPRDAATKSWRPEALDLLNGLGWDGAVFVPEPVGGHTSKWLEHEPQLQWEQAALKFSVCVAFWVPSTPDTMPALMTRIEFGQYVGSRKMVFGAPKDAWKVGAMWYLCGLHGVTVADTLPALMRLAIDLARVRS
jgi:hypothetical protein